MGSGATSTPTSLIRYGLLAEEGLMKWVTVFALLLLSLPVAAEEGYVHGDNHCFHFTAPNGWVADNVTGRHQGIPFVFYPRGSTWAGAPTVIYARVAERTAILQTPKDQVDLTVTQFRAEYQSPNITARHVTTLRTQTGATAEFYRFTGDKAGSTELVAYFTGKHTINFFVMTSRDEADLNRQRGVLEELARSYREAEDCRPCEQAVACAAAHPAPPLPATLEEAIAQGRQHEHGEATREYHRATLMPYFGTKYAPIFKQCFDTAATPDDRPFQFVAALDAQGRVLQVYRSLETGIFRCMNTRLAREVFPAPPVAPYFLYVNMQFTK